MTKTQYFVGIDIASRTFTATVGTMPWKVVLKPQEFENSEDGFPELLDWLNTHQLPAEQSIVCMEATASRPMVKMVMATTTSRRV